MAHKNGFSTHAGSGMCELPYQERSQVFWRGDLKETGAKTEGEYSAIAKYEKTSAFME